LDDDGTLPSQFGKTHHALTPFGQFIIKYRITIHSALTNITPYESMYPQGVHYDCAVVFPNFGILNYWLINDPKRYGVNVFDQLGNILEDISTVELAQTMALGPEAQYAFWCDDVDFDPQLLVSKRLYEQTTELATKFRYMMPSKVWREMYQAKEDTERDIIDGTDGP
tara:strand:+ start:83 stop:586 length:504 start_codon:yes stop_codon:yes gene_type:complete